jgi:hypothetical protein
VAGRGKQKKEFQEYLTDPTRAHVGHEDYLTSPGTAFLKYTVEAKSAADLCVRKFPKKGDGAYTKDAQDSLQHIIAAMVPAVMGHFETYQRYLFAGMFDSSVHLEKFDIGHFFKKISKVSDVAIDPIRLSAHRGLGAQSVGILMADCLSGWHNPERVNEFFDAFGLKRQLFASDDCARLRVLWQLRHSIVHTGGTLTLPDAQKLTELFEHGNKKVVFENNFIYEVSRKLHPLVKRATEGIGTSFKDRFKAAVPADVKTKIDEFFSVKSSISIWLKT